MRCSVLGIGALLLCAACGSTSSPTSPATTPTVVVTPPSLPVPSVTTTGHVTATNGGQPLPGLNVDLAGKGAATTDGAGVFIYTTTGGTARLTLTGGGILTRSLVLAVTTRDVAVDAVALTTPFDPAFYRQFVRNAFETPADIQPLRRWTRTPSIYLKTVDSATRSASGIPTPRPT